MKPKPLWKVSITTTAEAEEAVTEILGGILNRAVSSWFELESAVSTVTGFCETRPERSVRQKISTGLARIQNCGLKTGPGKITIAEVRREDWAESWKRHFKPIEIGATLLVKPSWSRRRPRKNQAVVVLDPGLSFGTGQHPTTSFCLREIARHQKKETRQSFLDIGTGSGILAIVAAKLGYAPVNAFDFDPDAVKIARSNARMNGVGGKVRIQHGDVKQLRRRPAQRCDLICANLIANLLVAEGPRIVGQMRPGGTLVLAGILKSEFAGVEKYFTALGLKLVASKSEKEWRSGSFQFA